MVIVAISGSVALLADTIHNFSDALTAIPLGLAFTLSRRARNSRYTYGYGRAEDIAEAVSGVRDVHNHIRVTREDRGIGTSTGVKETDTSPSTRLERFWGMQISSPRRRTSGCGS